MESYNHPQPNPDDQPTAVPPGPGQAPESSDSSYDLKPNEPQRIAEPWIPRSYVPPQNDRLLKQASPGVPGSESPFHTGTSDLTGSFTPGYQSQGYPYDGRPRQKGGTIRLDRWR